MRHQFNQLPINERAHVVTQSSRYLEWFTAHGFIYHIYLVGHSFVCVQYDSEHDQIVDIYMMDNGRDLQWMVDLVNIDDIWQG